MKNNGATLSSRYSNLDSFLELRWSVRIFIKSVTWMDGITKYRFDGGPDAQNSSLFVGDGSKEPFLLAASSSNHSRASKWI